jgi:hypothetical protein
MAKTINIAFRIPDSYAGELSDYSNGYESPSQTAKRLLMEFLDGKHSQDSEPTPQAVPAVGDFGDLGDRLSALEKKAGRIGAQEQLIAMQKATTEAIYTDFKKMCDRLSALENQLVKVNGDRP